MIALRDCEHRRLYRLDARQLTYGVFDKNMGGFIGIRKKFDKRFLDSENHWECEKFATAKPLEALGMLPEGIECSESNNPTLFEWLDQQIPRDQQVPK